MGSAEIRIIADASILRAFGSIRRLELLAPWRPFYVTPLVVEEVWRSRRGSVISECKRGEREGWLLLARPPPATETEAVLAQDKDHRLSYEDAEQIALAKRAGADILSDDGRLGEVAEQFGIAAYDVVDLLFYLKEEAKVLATQKAMREVIEALEQEDRNRKFNAAERAELLRF